MNVVADLHIHSRYSRACSKYITIPNLEKYARLKGLQLMGTGDFQHPKWYPELKENLKDDGNGVLYTESGYPFVLQTELSFMYSQDGTGRRVHLVVMAPGFEIGDQVVEFLGSKGRLDYDGRPIFSMSCDEVTESLKAISEDIEIIPAHVWTPWFSVFGSKSGFDSLQTCFKDQTKHIYALETGLSSDPAMNWRLSQLDNLTLISNSDSHSHWPWRIGREATVFDMKKMSYAELIKAIRENKVVETLEYFPEEGRYHYDGHSKCGVCMPPAESKKVNFICPKCKKGMTVGVATRVEGLADREEGSKSPNARPFRNLIPLSEIISHVIGTSVATKKVWEVYNKLVKEFGTELTVLSASETKIAKHVDKRLAHAIANVGKVKWKAGYDGEYGVPLFNENSEDQLDLGKWN